jgi:hypothetical protein
MTFVPVIVPVPQSIPDLAMRVQNLEAALASSMHLLQSLVEKLETRFGPGFLGEEFEQFASIGRHVADQVAEIDRLIKDGHQPAAARAIREMCGVTWDQAHYITNRWPSLQAKQKIRWLQLNQFTHHVSPTVAPSE